MRTSASSYPSPRGNPMKRFLGVALVTAFLAVPTWADDAAVQAVLDKAIKALGGAEALGKAQVLRWKSKGTITFNGNDNTFTGQSTVQGLDHLRAEFEGDFGGNPFKAVIVLNGDQGWRRSGDEMMGLDADSVAREKRMVYLQVVPALV